MSATVEICESNGAGQTVTHNISNTNMGNVDAANLDALASPIPNGNRSYIKYQRIHVTNMGGSSKVRNLKIWRTGVLGGSAEHKTNARESGYAGAIAYATPVNTAVSGVDQDMPTAVPSSANLGIGGSLSGEITAIGYSDYLAHQIVTDIDDVSGASYSMNYRWDEIA